ncbi:MAG: hypothetical protein ACXW30_06815 [Micavibrio sp.]
MKTTMNKILMTASFLTIVTVAMPAMANPSVLCSVRANYEAAGSGAAYQPGVDVDGKPVAPADTSAPVNVVPQTLRIPLTVDLAQRLNEVLPDTAKLETEVGVVEVRQDGHVIINGKDLTGPAIAMCNTIEKQKEAALKTKDAPKKRAVVKPVEPEVTEPVVAEPAVVEPVVETPVVEEPQVESAPEAVVEPTIADPVVAEPTPAEPVPQVLEPTPPPPQMPEEAAPAPAPELMQADPEVAVPPPAEVISPAPDDGAILSPTEGGIPRPPMDPLAGTPTEPPAPAPMSNDANGGMLSGGAQ